MAVVPDAPHIVKMKQEVKKADEDMRTTKDINYHKYNQYVINKGLQINTEIKKQRDAEANAKLNDASYEAAMQIKSSASRVGSFFFEGLDKILDKK